MGSSDGCHRKACPVNVPQGDVSYGRGDQPCPPPIQTRAHKTLRSHPAPRYLDTQAAVMGRVSPVDSATDRPAFATDRSRLPHCPNVLRESPDTIAAPQLSTVPGHVRISADLWHSPAHSLLEPRFAHPSKHTIGCLRHSRIPECRRQVTPVPKVQGVVAFGRYFAPRWCIRPL